MKITEALKQDETKPVLIAYVNKDTGTLADIMERSSREMNESLLDNLTNQSLEEDLSEEKKDELSDQITKLKAELSKVEAFEFELTNPTYDVLSAALSALYTTDGKMDMTASGRIVFDSCYTGNQGSLEEIQELSTLYLSLCSKCYHSVVDIADIEYKKK